jgi:hypothetical protein
MSPLHDLYLHKEQHNTVNAIPMPRVRLEPGTPSMRAGGNSSLRPCGHRDRQLVRLDWPNANWDANRMNNVNRIKFIGVSAQILNMECNLSISLFPKYFSLLLPVRNVRRRCCNWQNGMCIWMLYSWVDYVMQHFSSVPLLTENVTSSGIETLPRNVTIRLGRYMVQRAGRYRQPVSSLSWLHIRANGMDILLSPWTVL